MTAPLPGQGTPPAGRDAGPVEVAGIRSVRLDLVWLSPAFLRASLAGDIVAAERILGASLPESWPDARAANTMLRRLEQMRQEPDEAPWLLRAMVRRQDRQVVGYINFHGAPDAEGRAELGYTVFEPYRRQGYASEAAQAMMGWAHEEHGVQRFIVSISPANEASLGMAAKLGFHLTGTQMDEIDGEEHVFELVTE